jgi:hypothetical protein
MGWKIETPYGTMSGDGEAPHHVIEGLQDDGIPLNLTIGEGTPRAVSFGWRWPPWKREKPRPKR